MAVIRWPYHCNSERVAPLTGRHTGPIRTKARAMKDTVASKVDASAQQAVHKQDRSRVGRFLRLIGAAVDPWALAHLIKIVNYYNYTHVAPRRAAHLGHDVRLSPTVSLSNPSNVHIGDPVSYTHLTLPTILLV